MAKYLILIYGDERRWDSRTPEQAAATDAGHRAFTAKAGTAVLGGHVLADSSVTTTLRDAHSVTDGPFLETKEGLGGFYLLEAGDLDEVIELVKLLPELEEGHCGIEIRPIMNP